MGIVFPVEPQQRPLPAQILYELNIILDESKPLPLRASLLVKWLNFLRAYGVHRDLPEELASVFEGNLPSMDKLSPRILREYARRLAAVVAAVFYPASNG